MRHMKSSRYTSKKLVELFVSQSRVKILAYVFLHPAEPFHLRKICRITEIGLNAASRELGRLEASGVLFAKKERQKKQYFLNLDYPLLTELRSMFHREIGLGGQLMNLRENLGKISLMVLTKPYIDGNLSSPEDLDLLIVGKPDVRMIKVCADNTQELIDKEINYMILTESDFAFRYRRRADVIVRALHDESIVLVKKGELF